MTPHQDQQDALLPALVCAALASSHRGSGNSEAEPESPALPEAAVRLISSFLDFARPQFWSIPRACDRRIEADGTTSDLRLLQRLLVREPSDLDRYYRTHLFNQALVNAVASERLDIVEWLCTKYLTTGSASAAVAMERAAELGELQILQWLDAHYGENVVWRPRFMNVAAQNGHLDVLEWLHAHPKNVGCTCEAMERAVQHGDFEIVQWLYERYPVVSSCSAIHLAVRYGHLEIAKFLHQRGYQTPAILDCAALSGRLDIVQWLHHALQVTNSASAMDLAAGSGFLDIVQWLHLNGLVSSTNYAMDWAAQNGHMDVIKWLHENRLEPGCSKNVMRMAALSGHLDVIQWLHEHRPECSAVLAIESAAEGGHLHVMEWVHATRKDASFRQAMDKAAGNGQLEALQWLHEHGASCSTEAMDSAARDGHLEVVKWLHENRHEGCTTLAMDAAAREGHLETVRWLHANRMEGCTTAAMDSAGSIEMVRWLHENRSEGCTTAAMENAINNGDFNTVLFLHMNRHEGCSANVILAIARPRVNNLPLTLWMCEKYRDVLDLGALRAELKKWQNRRYNEEETMACLQLIEDGCQPPKKL